MQPLSRCATAPPRGSVPVRKLYILAGNFTTTAKSRPPGEGGCERSEQTEGVPPRRRAFAESGAANAVSRYDPSREKAILENPQIFQNCEIINNLSADDAQSKAERILNRSAIGGTKTFLFA